MTKTAAREGKKFMKSFDIEHVKNATYMMFAKDAFDGLLLVEANMNVLVNYNIDGHLNKNFLTEDEAKEAGFQNEYVHWGDIRKFCFDIIKGKKVPLGLKFVFKLPKEYVPVFLQRNKIEDIRPESVTGLFMNIKFENNRLICVTGTALAEFSVGDRRVENAWDAEIEKFIRQIDRGDTQ